MLDSIAHMWGNPVISEAWTWDSWILLCIGLTIAVVLFRTMRFRGPKSASIAKPFAQLVLLAAAAIAIVLVDQWIDYHRSTEIDLARASVEGAARNITQSIRQYGNSLNTPADDEKQWLPLLVLPAANQGSTQGGYAVVEHRLQDIADLLANAQVPGQSLLLVQQLRPSQIDISASGLRHSSTFGWQLLHRQLASALHIRPVDGTCWTLVALANPGVMAYKERFLWTAALSIYALVCLITGLLVGRLLREERRRRRYEAALINAQHELEDKILERTRELHEQKELAQITLASIGDGVITTDVDGLITSMNQAAEKLTGWVQSTAFYLPVEEVFCPVDEVSGEPVDDPVSACLREGATRQLPRNSMIVHRSGMDIAVEDSAAPIRDSDNHIIGAVLVFRDVSESRSHARQIEHQASHDALTGLINRSEFEKRLNTSLQGARMYDHDHALMFLDLDRFKPINDSCGHAAGDELLRQIARVMMEKLRQRDTLARIGGDEFAILLEHCPLSVALRIANEICSAVNNYRYFHDQHVFQIGVSIGLTPINRRSGSASDITRHADSACYIAKESGRNRVHLYNNRDAQKKGESKWVAHITEAFDEKRMLLFSTPTRTIRSQAGMTSCHKISIGMLDRQGNQIDPDAFMPKAERFGLLTRLDRWVTGHTLQWLWETPGALENEACYFVSLSGQTLKDQQYLAFVDELLEQYPVSPQQICFQIAEADFISNREKANTLVEALKEKGCRLALDAFGNGLASFSYLKQLPVDFINIDDAYLSGMHTCQVDRAMVEFICEICGMLEIKTIATRVTDQLSVHLLQDIGVDYIQGPVIGEPQPVVTMKAALPRAGTSS